jgi:hypothetical protein
MGQVFELVLKGFDGGTDETDDKIIWIAVDHPVGNLFIKLNDNPSNPIHRISELDIDINSAGIDMIIEKHFNNFYKCDNCNTHWISKWSCQCNDRCPDCGVEIEPFESREV